MKSTKLLKKAIKLYKQGNFSAAKSCCQRILRSSKDVAVPHFLLGCIARSEGREGLELAVTQFKKAIAIDSRPFEFYLNLGDTYQQLGDFNNALTVMRESLHYIDSPSSEAIVYCSIGNILRSLTDFRGAIAALQRAIELNPQMAVAHTGIGVVLFKVNRYQDAIHSFDRSIALNPDYSAAYRNLGLTYMLLGQREEALSALNQYIQLHGPDTSVLYMIAALCEQNVESPPIEHIEKLFDDFADNFEKQLTDLEYDIPAKMLKMLALQSILGTSEFHTVLDLGCGTGLMGQLLAPYSEAIDGVDLSQSMIAKAKGKSVYRRLFKSDIVSFLNRPNNSTIYSIIVAADTLVYLGDLEPLFDVIKSCDSTQADTVFIFSVESSDKRSYQLLPTGRYAHSEDYIEQLCTSHGLTVMAKEQTMIRKEHGEAIHGTIFMIR